MSKAVIPSYTLLDFLSEGDMLAFFTFFEENMEGMPPISGHMV